MKRLRSFRPLDIALLLVAVLFVSPCLLAVLNAFKTLPEITRAPLSLPQRLNWQNFADIFSSVGLARPMLNSFLMCVAVIGTLIVLGSMTAYSLTRRKMSGAAFWRTFFLLGLTIPFQIVMVPLLKEFRWLGIHTTYFALWLHYISWGLPLCIFIYSGFVTTIPRELEEAAELDGCGPLTMFWRVVFPLLAPCTTTIIIFWGLWTWNDFMQAFVVMGPNKGQLVFVQLWRYLSDNYVKNWNTIFAGAVVLSLPVTLLYLLMQRRFIKGITAGSYR